MILIVLKIDTFGFFIKIFQALCIYCNLEGFFSTVFRLDSARNTAVIHKEKFDVPLNKLYRFQKQFKTFTGLKEIARSKGLGEKPKSARSRLLEFKRQAVALKEPIYILRLLAFAEISFFFNF